MGQPCKVIFTALTTPVYREAGAALRDHTALSEHRQEDILNQKDQDKNMTKTAGASQ